MGNCFNYKVSAKCCFIKNFLTTIQKNRGKFLTIAASAANFKWMLSVNVNVFNCRKIKA